MADEEPGCPEQRVYVRLADGNCQEARAGTREDEQRAQFVIRAERQQWIAALEGKLDPVYALMRGRLRLTRGMLSALLPNADAARWLVRSARDLPR